MVGAERARWPLRRASGHDHAELAGRSRQTDEILTALNYLPEGAKVASVVLTPREFWWFNKQEHVGGYIVIRRHALVNMNFALPHIHMLHVKEGGPGFADPSHRLLQSIYQPVRLDCIRPAYHADWLLYVGAKVPETLPDHAQLVWQGKDVLLAQLPNTGIVPDRCKKPRLPDRRRSGRSTPSSSICLT
jgi:hypothetical protein